MTDKECSAYAMHEAKKLSWKTEEADALPERWSGRAVDHQAGLDLILQRLILFNQDLILLLEHLQYILELLMVLLVVTGL